MGIVSDQPLKIIHFCLRISKNIYPFIIQKITGGVVKTIFFVIYY